MQTVMVNKKNKPMSIKLKISLHTDNALNEATQIAKQLKDKNMRGVKVRQAEAEPEDGSLDFAELLPWVSLAISSPFVKTVALKVIDMVNERLKTLSNERIEKDKLEVESQKIASNERIKMAETEQKRDYIELAFECGEKKMNFKLTKDDPEQQKQIMQAIMEMQNDCE